MTFENLISKVKHFYLGRLKTKFFIWVRFPDSQSGMWHGVDESGAEGYGAEGDELRAIYKSLTSGQGEKTLIFVSFMLCYKYVRNMLFTIFSPGQNVGVK